MKVMAQVTMVMNLDKCIGCHTCSVTCKQVWTNREGMEYAWFNNVETRPGKGYPDKWEDQETFKGGWVLSKKGKLVPKLEGKMGKFKEIVHIFSNPYLPTINDYYIPWTYNYDNLISSKGSDKQPVAKPESLFTGKKMDISNGPNWDDDLANGKYSIENDVNIKNNHLEEQIKSDFESSFMFYLPRICNHCLNPTCASVCPSGAIYKRDEDGIVLIDQDRCQGWRFCVSGCPYKKIYFNWKTHKSEKCTFCYPRIENGLPTVCSETCVGKIRYIGLLLYDEEKVIKAAEEKDDNKLIDSQLDVILDPFDENVIKNAVDNKIPYEWIESAQNSPVYKLIKKWKLAFPLHPEYRTLPMVWYVPPLSPITNNVDSTSLFADIDNMRIPLEYLASLFSAGNTDKIKDSLKKLLAMRYYMRTETINGKGNNYTIKDVGLTPDDIHGMYRLLAISKYNERFVIPSAHREEAENLLDDRGMFGFENTCPEDDVKPYFNTAKK